MSKQFPHPFSKLASDFRVMRRELPKEVSDIAVDEFKHNFRIGGYRGNAGVVFWQKLKESKGNSGRAILIKKGRLRRGIRPQPTYDSARVINDVPYAKAHNEGFKGTVRVRGFRRRIKKRFVNVKGFKRKMNLPARPHMITGQPLLNNIDTNIQKRIERLWEKTPNK